MEVKYNKDKTQITITLEKGMEVDYLAALTGGADENSDLHFSEELGHDFSEVNPYTQQLFDALAVVQTQKLKDIRNTFNILPDLDDFDD